MYAPFQFHDGAIGRQMQQEQQEKASPFQFHDGAIGSASYSCDK